MVWKPARNMLLHTGLLLLIISLALVGCGQNQPGQSSKQSANTSDLTFQKNAAPAAPASFAPAGSAVWILSCLDGWEKQKIYQTNPYYTNQQGIQRAKDIYVFGNFWLQPGTGTLLSYADQPAMQQCLSDLITTAHDQYHAQVCGVIGVNESSNGWKAADVVAYTRRVVATPALLTPLVNQVKQYPYDCIINDIEDGNSANPQVFSQYDALLRSKLPVPLGQTLLWKTQDVQAYWQKWQDWGTLATKADFFIVMALDQDSINDPPVPASIVNYWWVKEIYAYMRSITSLFGTHPIAWELPTYYRLFTQQQDGSWAVSSGTDVEAHIATALQSPMIPQNYLQDPNDPYIEYTNARSQSTYLFFETARSSDVLAQTLTVLNGSHCLLLSFWDNDSGTSNTLGWSTILNDKSVHLC
jgi:hypothetical protein